MYAVVSFSGDKDVEDVFVTNTEEEAVSIMRGIIVKQLKADVEFWAKPNFITPSAPSMLRTVTKEYEDAKTASWEDLKVFVEMGIVNTIMVKEVSALP